MDGTGMEQGDCGSFFTADNQPNQHPLVGIYVAGSVNRVNPIGIVTLVTQEMIEEITGKDKEPVVYGPPINTEIKLQGHLAPFDSTTRVIPVGLAPPGMGANLPQKSNLRKSLIYEKVRPHKHEPAAMTKNDPRLNPGVTPLKLGLSKFGKGTLPFKQSDLDYGAKALVAELKRITPKYHDKSILTEMEAINGKYFPCYGQWMGLDFSTSPGYPYIKTKNGRSGKLGLFAGEIGARYITDPILRAKLDERLACLSLGERVETIAVDNFKDELRPNHKVAEGKTRMITTMPVDYTIAFRMYFGAFCAFFNNEHHKFWSSIGCDPESYDWTFIQDYLAKNAPLGFDSDYGNYDGSLHSSLILLIAWVVTEWYGDNYLLERMVLMNELAFTYHMIMIWIYITVCGHPSGHPFTSILNTLINFLLFLIVWRIVIRENPKRAVSFGLDPTVDSFNQNVKVKYYGDDNAASVKRQALELFNAKTFADTLEPYGYKVTPAIKSNEVVAFKPIGELQFLKRGFRRCGHKRNLWHPTMDEDVIYDMLNYVRDSANPRERLMEKVRIATVFAFHHGQEFYERFVSEVNTALEPISLPLIVADYEGLHHLFVVGKYPDVTYTDEQLDIPA
jgi:hypothetical protein